MIADLKSELARLESENAALLDELTRIPMIEAKCAALRADAERKGKALAELFAARKEQYASGASNTGRLAMAMEAAEVEVYAARAALSAAPVPAQAGEGDRDTDRLDWLEQHDGRFYNIDRISSIVGGGFNGHHDLRYAIDTARQAQGANESEGEKS